MNSAHKIVNSHFLDSLRELLGPRRVLLDEPMCRHTSFQTGGPCDMMVIPRTQEEIISLVRLCREHGIHPVVLGNGTNVLVSDKGIRGFCMKIAGGFDTIQTDGETFLIAQAGALLSAASKKAWQAGLSGLEFASGIPGTIGGAVCMNAGAYGSEIKNVLASTTYVDSVGNLHTIGNSDHRFRYRTSVFSDSDDIILECSFQMVPGDTVEIGNMMREYNHRRRDTQPLDVPSAGSVFKRPQGFFVGRLIEDCKLKGYCVSGAEVSQKHAGFIVNKTRKATSKDIRNLIEHVADTVLAECGVALETEIKMIGEW